MNTLLSNKAYDRLKFTTQVVLPATASLYFGLSQIWGLPAGEQVVGSIALITTFFGVLLGISTKNYQEDPVGDAVFSETRDGDKTIQFELDDKPDILGKDRIIFRVVHREAAYWEEPHVAPFDTTGEQPIVPKRDPNH